MVCQLWISRAMVMCTMPNAGLSYLAMPNAGRGRLANAECRTFFFNYPPFFMCPNPIFITVLLPADVQQVATGPDTLLHCSAGVLHLPICSAMHSPPCPSSSIKNFSWLRSGASAMPNAGPGTGWQCRMPNSPGWPMPNAAKCVVLPLWQDRQYC